MFLIAIDPAISKTIYAAKWSNSLFKGWEAFSYQEFISQESKRSILPGEKFVVVIEKPYCHPKNNPQRQMNFFLGVGSLAQVFRNKGCEVTFADSWGNTGWLQQSFGKAVRSEVAVKLAIAKAKDYVKRTAFPEIALQLDKKPDLAMSICLGLYWLDNQASRA